MISYLDMSFCSAKCANTNCPRNFTAEHSKRAVEWWGGENAPVSWADFEGGGTCRRAGGFVPVEEE